MKNKNFTRFLCFFMCFCLCFAWFGPPIEAKASGTALLGVLIAFMISSGIGFAVSGAANSLTDGLLDLVESYETNVYDGDLDFWDVLAVGSSIGTLGELLLNKAAVDALNGFMNWLTTDGGWSKGEDTEYLIDEISFYSSNDLVSYTNIKIGTLKKWDSSTKTGDIDVAPTWVEANAEVYSSDTQLIFYSPDGYKGGKFEFYYEPSGFANYGIWGWSHESYAGTNFTSIAGNQLGNYNKNDIVSYGIFVDPNYTNSRLMICGLLSSGQVICLIDGIYKSVTSLNENEQNCIVTVPAEITEYEVTDSQQLSLFNGSSGKIPSSVTEYNDLFMESVNDCVIPDVTSEVVVDDSVIEPDIETDGSLEGNVSGIFTGVQTLIELIKSIPSLILDGIKSIFIPDPDDMNNLYLGLLDEVNEKYGFDFDMGSLFGSEKQPDDITGNYSVGPLSWNLTFVSWGFLIDAVAALRPYIRGWLILMLVFYNMKQFGMLFNIDGLIGGMSPSEWNSAMTPKVDGDFSLNGAYKGGKK